VCMSVCLSVCPLITREWVGQLSPNFQVSSRAPGNGFRHRKIGGRK